MLQAGSLNRRITIQRQSADRDEDGHPEAVWTDVVVTWASIAHKSGLQSIRGDAEVSLVQASIRVRYRTDVAAGMRVVHGSTIYQIRAVLPDERGREFTDLVCEVIE
ncbi:phage head closure protein [Paraburkholderia sp. CNPSo 3157]|uniref:Phage head closure protein n=1 Tax=Paraburkholderia franconis TaxID=2654983 RepID=A0A7X1TG64_9BURK|nr:phage head closure protein [Paraburkholderia franconis]MPW17879.1 phage head closure protein [Paraburkholderia franconis]